MGDWYDNYLTVLGPTADRASFKEKAVGVYPYCDGPSKRTEALCFENFIPTPATVLQPDKREACRDWRVENWAAVYGAVNSELRSEREDRLNYYFEAKYGPPITFFRNIGPLWPTLTFRLRYSDMYEDEVDGICEVSGESINVFERKTDLKKGYAALTDEQFLAIGAEWGTSDLIEKEIEEHLSEEEADSGTLGTGQLPA
jgi:hypothetical protein